MDTAVRSFLTYLHIERKASPHTLRNYGQDLRQFLDFLRRDEGSLRSPQQIEPITIRSFMALRANQGDSKATRSRKLSAIRSLFRYLAREGQITRNPGEAVRGPKQERKLPTVLTADDAKRLMDDCIRPRSFRDQALLETLYSSGARVSEVVNLNLDDVDLHEGIATVLGKGRKERIVPLGTQAVRALGQSPARCSETSAEVGSPPAASSAWWPRRRVTCPTFPASVRMGCGTPSRLIYWTAAWTCGRFRNS